MSTGSPPIRDHDDVEERETPLDLLINAISDPKDQTSAGAIDDAYDLGGFGLANVGYDGQMTHVAADDGAEASRDGMQQPTTVATLASSGEPSRSQEQQRIIDLVKQAVARKTRTDSSAAYEPGESTMVQVWHPLAAIKSYEGERRRLLTPPPFVRVCGPLLPHISSLTITSIPETAPGPTMTSQTHRLETPPSAAPTTTSVMQINPATGLPPIGVGYSVTTSSTAPPQRPPRLTPRRIKKLANLEAQQRLKELASRSGFAETLPHERTSQAQKDREALQDGLTFAGMWCMSETARGASKTTAFRLGLEVYTTRDQRDRAGDGQEGQDGGALDESQFADMAGIGDADPSAGFSAVDPQVSTTATPKPWLNLTSAPVTILSKSGIKTFKARSLVGTLDIGMPFALCVRIHAQTVRTRYVRTGASGAQTCLTARTGKWDPYHFDVIQPPLNTGMTGEEHAKLAGKLLYGSVGRMRDVYTGAVSAPMKLVKTDLNEAINGGTESGDGDPVAHLQKVAFVRMVRVDPALTGGREEWIEAIDGDSGGRLYLAAPGARAGGGELRHESSAGYRKKRKYPPRKQKGTGTPAMGDEPNSRADDAGVDPALDDIPAVMLDAAVPDPPTGIIPAQEIDTAMPDTLADTLMQQPAEHTAYPDNANSHGQADHSIPVATPSHFDSYMPNPLSDLPAGGDVCDSALSAPASGDASKRDVKRKTRRGDLAQAVVAEGEGDENVRLTWEPATFSKVAVKQFVSRVHASRAKEDKEVRLEGVADWMMFVLCGVGSFSSSFEEIRDKPSEVSDLPYRPAAPMQALGRPILYPSDDYRSASLQVLINQDSFVPPDRNLDVLHDTPLPVPQVFLGTLGPLECKIMRSTSQVTDSVQPVSEHPAYVDPFRSDPTHPALGAKSSFPAKIPHLLLYLVLPDVAEVKKAMQDLAKTANVDKEQGHGAEVTIEPVERDPPRQPVMHAQNLQSQTVLDTQLADLDNDLGFGQALDEPSWLADYTSAIQGMQGEMDDTEAIRLALQSVQDEARQAEMDAAGHTAHDPAFAQAAMGVESTSAPLGALVDEDPAMTRVPEQNTMARLVQGPMPTSDQAAIRRDEVNGGDTDRSGPILLSNTSSPSGHKRVPLPIIIVRSGAGAEETLFHTGFGVDLDSGDGLRVVNV